MWLHYLIQRWQHLEHAPVGLHSDDYKALLETQKSPFEDLMELVFGQEGFTHIEGQTLYEAYKAYLGETNPAARGAVKRNTFYEQVRVWHKKNQTGVQWGKIKVSGRGGTVVVTTAHAFFVPGRTLFQDNRDEYKVGPGTVPFWHQLPVEPRVKLANPVDVVFGEEPKLIEEAIAGEVPRKSRFASSV